MEYQFVKNNIFVCLFHNNLMFNENVGDDVFLIQYLIKRSFNMTLL